MIPLRDDVRSATVPYVNYALIAANAAAFAYELALGPRLERFFAQSAVVPLVFSGGDGRLGPVEAAVTLAAPALGLRVLASMFLHGGWAHILGNMLYLWIFGDNVEDRMGHGRYLAFYLVCGWIASYAHIFADPASALPSIGASGAIAGVLGAYITLYPRARVITLIPLGFFTELVALPAVFFLGFWFLQQFVSGALSLTQKSATGGVAWWAHIGGFAAGFILVYLFARKRGREADSWWEDQYPGRRVRGWS